jgi:hypothetical protein
MNVLNELNELLSKMPAWRELLTLADRVSAIEEKLNSRSSSIVDDRPTCPFCGVGKLRLIDAQPDPNFGALGMIRETLKCDARGCGKLTRT